jgi:hypothetical protein
MDTRKVKNSANLKIKALDHNLTSNRRRWYGHVLRKNKDRIPKKVLNMQLNGKCHNDGNNNLGSMSYKKKK